MFHIPATLESVLAAGFSALAPGPAPVPTPAGGLVCTPSAALTAATAFGTTRRPVPVTDVSMPLTPRTDSLVDGAMDGGFDFILLAGAVDAFQGGLAALRSVGESTGDARPGLVECAIEGGSDCRVRDMGRTVVSPLASCSASCGLRRCANLAFAALPVRWLPVDRRCGYTADPLDFANVRAGDPAAAPAGGGCSAARVRFGTGLTWSDPLNANDMTESRSETIVSVSLSPFRRMIDLAGEAPPSPLSGTVDDFCGDVDSADALGEGVVLVSCTGGASRGGGTDRARDILDVSACPKNV